MRRIYVEEGLNVRFPGRSEDFAQGVEIGIALALLSSAQSNVTLWMSSETLEQVQALCCKMGFRSVVRASEGGASKITLMRGRARAELRLVHSDQTAERAQA